jgi:hypothetical protein
MDVFVAIFVFIIPVLVAAIYSQFVYGMSLSDNLIKWQVGKVIAIILVLILLLLMFIGSDEYTSNLLFFLPGSYISLIIYSKPCAELFFGENSDFKKVGLLEDAGFIVGFICLLHLLSETIIYY